MDKPMFQMVPLWLIFVATVGFILLLALAFAAVFHLIADLDRPDAGFLTVSQQSLPDLQTRWHRQ